MFVRREGNNNIWHKLLEMWQVELTLDALQMIDLDHHQENRIYQLQRGKRCK